MQLKPLSAQQDSFRDYYSSLRDSSERWEYFGGKMLALVEHIENKVEAPPQWAYSDMVSNLWLSKFDKKHSGRVMIQAIPKPGGYDGQQLVGYEIIYHLDAPWSHVVGYTSDLEVAGKMILQAIERSGW